MVVADSDFIEGPGLSGPVGFGVSQSRPVLGVNVNLLRLGLAL